MMKAGFAGEEKPSLIFPSYIGKAKYEYVLPTVNQQNIQMGNIKDETRGLFKLKYPIEHGIIKDWKSMDLIWNYIF
jgi:centractin